MYSRICDKVGDKMTYRFVTVPSEPAWVYWVDEIGKPIARILWFDLQQVIKEK